MKTAIRLLLMMLCCTQIWAQGKNGKKVLVFYETAGFYHTSIPIGVAAIQKLGKEHGFSVDTTRKSDGYFTPEQLAGYKAVIFLNTTGDVFDEQEKAAFHAYIRNGGGFVGVHAATDTEYKWPWYNQLVGAYFKSHPQQQDAILHITDDAHPATTGLPKEWKRWDEWYNFKDIQPHIKVLMRIDETSYKGGQNGNNHPISWYHEFEGGKSFYTALGHTNESYSDPLFLKHLLGGIRYAMGN